MRPLGKALCVYALAGAFSLAGHAAQVRSITDGVYSPVQADRGRQIYQAECAGCHGNAMEGTAGPPLAGDSFLSNWSARPLASLVDKEARGEPITLPDGTTVPRLPGYRRWLWDGEFCGTIGLRWQRGTEALPPYCLGHIGYAVVPWKQGRGYATRALREMLREAKAVGLRYVEITTDPDNVASQHVIEANRGVLVEKFVKPAALGGKDGLRYRVNIEDGA